MTPREFPGEAGPADQGGRADRGGFVGRGHTQAEDQQPASAQQSVSAQRSPAVWPTPRPPSARAATQPEGQAQQPHEDAATARGHPSRARRRPQPRMVNLPYAIVLAGVLAGLLWVWQSQTHVKGGTMTVAAALLAAAGARLLLPDDRAGLLANRRRGVDATALAVLGAGLLAAALVIPSPS